MHAELKRARIVFWDFDGVIKESVRVKTDAYHALFLPFGEHVADRVREHHLANGGMSRFDKIPLYLGWAGQPATAEQVAEFCDRFAGMVEDAVVAADWVPGVRTVLLSGCDQQEYVLVTATPQEEIESILERLQIRHCFSRVFGAPVSKATGMLQRLTELGIDPQLALMIGDSREDFAAAQRCSVPFLLRRTPENVRSMPDYSGPHIAGFEQS